MTCRYLRLILTSIALMILPLTACGSSEAAAPAPDVVFDFTDDTIARGCVQPGFPEEQPDLFALDPPRFITDAPNGQAAVRPGVAIDARIPVNGATRQVLVELRDVWTPDVMVYATEEETAGNLSVPVILFSQPQNLGRFYMKITLCGLDCDERQVIFDVNPDHNTPYERTLVEDGEVIRVDKTCVDLTTDVNVGSGTVLIQ